MSRPRPGILLLGAACVVLLAVVVIRVVGLWAGSDGPPADEPQPSPPPASADDTANVATFDDPEVVQVVGVLDSFARPDDDNALGVVPSGPPWSNDTGGWGIAGEQAYVPSPAAGRSHAVVDRGQGNGAVQVELSRVVHGAGLLFRYQDPQNYWAVVVAPSYATWAVVKVVEGIEETVGNTGLSPIADGTTVGVRMTDSIVDIVLDERVATTIVDDTLRDAGKVGLTAHSMPGIDAAAARFDDFVVSMP